MQRRWKLAIIALTLIFLLAIFLPAGRTARAAGIVGGGTSGSCTLAALQTALVGGGTVTFNCGGAKTIIVTSALSITAPTLIDGGGLITLDGANASRIMVNHSTLTVQNLTFSHGLGSGTDAAANGGAIQSVYQSKLVVINCIFSHNVSSPSVTTPNAYDYGGGAIFTQGGFLTVRKSTFNLNSAINAAGAAIHGLRSDLTITDSVFTYNNATPGGTGGALYADGAQNNGFGKISIVNSTFDHNTAGMEGGAIRIYMYQANDATLIDHTAITNNTESGGIGLGGGLSYGNGKLTITSSLFAGNVVENGNAAGDGSGGGLAVAEDSKITIANTTFTGNDARGTSYNANGGAFYFVNVTQPVFIMNSTIAGNHAGWVGGGITGKPAILYNTIVANNTADNGPNHWGILQQCSDKVTDGGANIQFPGKNPNPNYYNETICTDQVRVVNPKLGALANNGGRFQTLALLTGSPAINAANNAVCRNAPVNNVDARDTTRNTGGDTMCDIGAYEYATQAVLPATVKTIGIYRAGVFYLRESNVPGGADLMVAYAPISNGYPVAGDWTGAGIDTIGVYNRINAAFLLRNSNTPGIPDQTFTLGIPNDQPLVGRWSGTATHDGAGVFRPTNGLIYLKNELTTGFADYVMVLGNPGDIGIAGDWTGVGHDTPGVFRPSKGIFYLSNKLSGTVFADYNVTFGAAGDLPIAGDWTGVGHAGVGFFHPSNGTMNLKTALTNGPADISLVYGSAGAQPVVGHWASRGNAPNMAPPPALILLADGPTPPTVAPVPAPTAPVFSADG